MHVKSQPAVDLKATGWTNDFESILTPSQIAELNEVIGKFEKETTIEIAVITLDLSMVKNDFENYVTSVGERWGVGKRDKDNGIVIGVSAGLRKIRISTGTGIQKDLPDYMCKKIIDEVMIPEFKKGNYYEGIRNGINMIIEMLR